MAQKAPKQDNKGFGLGAGNGKPADSDKRQSDQSATKLRSATPSKEELFSNE